MAETLLLVAVAALAVFVVLLGEAFLSLHRRHRAMRRELDRVSHEKHVLENRLTFRLIDNGRGSAA